MLCIRLNISCDSGVLKKTDTDVHSQIEIKILKRCMRGESVCDLFGLAISWRWVDTLQSTCLRLKTAGMDSKTLRDPDCG